MENLEPYLDKFSESGRRILESALNETRRRDQHFISPEHILYALMGEETDLFNATMNKLSIDPREEDFEFQKWKQMQRDTKTKQWQGGHWDIPDEDERKAVEQAAQMADRWQRMYFRAIRQLRELRRYAPTVANNNPN